MLRYLNMFVIIGLALVGISLVGFATHNRFLAEPGQADNSWASLTYLGAGVLMLINGYISIRQAPRPPVEHQDRSSGKEGGDSAESTETAHSS